MAGLNPGLPAVPAGKQRRPQGQRLSDTGMAEPGRGKVLMAPASRGAPGPAAEGPAAAGRQCSPQRTSAALSAARNPQKASAIHQPAVPRIGRNTDCTVPVVLLQALTASPARPVVPAGTMLSSAVLTAAGAAPAGYTPAVFCRFHHRLPAADFPAVYGIVGASVS